MSTVPLPGTRPRQTSAGMAAAWPCPRLDAQARPPGEAHGPVTPTGFAATHAPTLRA